MYLVQGKQSGLFVELQHSITAIMLHLIVLQLSREFRSILAMERMAGSLMNTWPEQREKVIVFAKVEAMTTRKLRQLLSSLERTDGIVHVDGRC